MLHRIARIGLAIVATALMTGAGHTRPLEKELPPRAGACWERVYDAAHLAAKPRQKVTAIRLISSPGENGGPDLAVELRLNLRTAAKGGPDTDGYNYKLYGFCKVSGTGMLCQPEWNAGTWRIEKGAGDTLIVRNGNITANPFEYDSEDVADDAVKIPSRPDDTAWMLKSVPSSMCPDR